MKYLSGRGKRNLISGIVSLIIAVVLFFSISTETSDYNYPVYAFEDTLVESLGQGCYNIRFKIKNITDSAITVEELNLRLFDLSDNYADITEKNIHIEPNSIFTVEGVYQITDLQGNNLTESNSYTDITATNCKINGESFIPAVSSDGVNIKEKGFVDFLPALIFLIAGILCIVQPLIIIKKSKKAAVQEQAMNAAAAVFNQDNGINQNNNQNNDVFQFGTACPKQNDDVFQFSEPDTKKNLNSGYQNIDSGLDNPYLALRKLKDSFEKGEITEFEFESRRKDILSIIDKNSR